MLLLYFENIERYSEKQGYDSLPNNLLSRRLGICPVIRLLLVGIRALICLGIRAIRNKRFFKNMSNAISLYHFELLRKIVQLIFSILGAAPRS